MSTFDLNTILTDLGNFIVHDWWLILILVVFMVYVIKTM